MRRIPVHMPAPLVQIAGCGKVEYAAGETVRDVLQDLLESHPRLRVHLFDESGGFRPHVLCYLNETNTRWLQSLDTAVADGDEMTILQAVSGG